MPRRPRPNACLLKPGHSLVFEGDSLTSRRTPPNLDTWPFLRLMNWHWTWAEFASELLFCWRPDLKLQFHISAVGGSNCRDLAARYERTVRPHRPAWVLLTLGANDANQGIPLAEFTRTLARYVRRVKEESGGRVAFIAGFRPCPHCPDEKRGSYAKRRRYYAALRRVARAEGALYVDAGAALRTKAELLYRQSEWHTVYSDGGHFNAVGNMIIAGEVLRALGVQP
jgi:lysophospholipase L1-like esterase